MGYFLKNRRLDSASSGVVIPSGPSSVRPQAPTFGLIRYNTELGAVEFFNGTAFVQLSTAGPITYTVDTFNGDGSTTDFTMSVEESQSTQIIVFIGSIYQDPTTAYTVDGSYNIHFTSAPPSGEPISVIHSAT